MSFQFTYAWHEYDELQCKKRAKLIFNLDNFSQVSACISTPIGNIQDKVGDTLKKDSDEAETAVKEANKKVTSAMNLFDKARDKLVSWESKVSDYEAKIQEACEKIEKIKEDLGDSCLDKCGEGRYVFLF